MADQNETSALQQWINDTHQLLQVLSDPGEVQEMTKCLLIGTKIQQAHLDPSKQTPGAQGASQGPPQGPPPGGPGAPAGIPPGLLAALQGGGGQ